MQSGHNHTHIPNRNPVSTAIRINLERLSRNSTQRRKGAKAQSGCGKIRTLAGDISRLSKRRNPTPPAKTLTAFAPLRLCVFALKICCLLAASHVSAGELFSTVAKPTNARVVVVTNPRATIAYQTRPEIIQAMVDTGITALTGSNSPAAAWASLITMQDIVGIKVYAAPGATCGTRPAVVAAVVRGLLAARVPAEHIVIWDRRLEDLRRAGFGELAARLGVRLAGAADAGYDEKVFYETALLGNLLWGDLEFGNKLPGVGRKSFVSKLLTHDLTRIINLAPLLNHNGAGVAGNLYGLAFGSVDNTQRFEDSADRLATVVPEICALPALGDRVALSITDALLCQYAGTDRGLLHYSATLNELRFSRDPVALDVLSLEELEQQRERAGFSGTPANPELIQNAALLELGTGDRKKIQVDNFR